MKKNKHFKKEYNKVKSTINGLENKNIVSVIIYNKQKIYNRKN